MSAATRRRAYRTRHKRIDYFPSPDVWPILQAYFAKYPQAPMQEILDAIVRTAHRSVSKQPQITSFG